MQLKKVVLSFTLLTFIGAISCKQENDAATNVSNPLAATWMVLHPAIDAELLIREDSTFHVDILMQTGIEAEGVLTIEGNNRLTFINTGGTDSTASNPVPGVYDFSIEADTLKFMLVSDTLSRRIGLLSYPWIKKE